MALGAQEMRLAVTVANETAPGIAAVVRTVEGAIRGLDAQIAGLTGRFEEQSARIARVTAPIAASFGQLRGHLRALSEESGLTRIGEGFAGVTEHIKRAHEALSDVLKPLGALTAMVGVGGVLETVKSTAERGERLHLESAATGLSVPQLAGLEYAGKLAGVENERTVRFVELLNRNIANFTAGRAGKDLTGIFADLNLKPGATAATALPVIEDRLRNLLASGNVTEATRIAGAVGGQRSGVALLPLLGQGHEKLGELAAEAAQHGQAMTDAQAAAAAKFMESYKQFDSSVIGLGQSISEDLFPTLTPIIEQMTKWTDANREWISTHIGEAVKSIAAGFRSIDWAGIGTALRALAEDAAGLARFLGPGGTLALLAGLKFAGAIREFGLLGWAITSTTARLIALPIAAFIGSFATLIPSISGVRDAWIALDLAASANPLGAAIAAATALGVVGYELYQHWGGVTAFFKKLWDDIAGFFEAGWDRIKPIIDGINAAGAAIVGWLGGGEAGGRQVHRTAPTAGPLSASQADLARRLVDEAAAHGVNRAHAVAMLGNASVESELNAAAPGGGMFQWSDPARQAAMRAALGSRAGDATAQFDYAISAAVASAINKPAPAKGQVDVTVHVDHRNPPPGTTATATQPDPVDLDFGENWATP